MAKPETLTQCQLKHRFPDGRDIIRVDVAWIQTKLAKLGIVLKFRDLEGTYEVTEIYSTKPKDEIEAFERCYLNQRSVSDA